jgi:hypothetical protein
LQHEKIGDARLDGGSVYAASEGLALSIASGQSGVTLKPSRGAVNILGVEALTAAVGPKRAAPANLPRERPQSLPSDCYGSPVSPKVAKSAPPRRSYVPRHKTGKFSQGCLISAPLETIAFACGARLLPCIVSIVVRFWSDQVMKDGLP